ncbi:hypothetical protein G7Y89_g12935 [Cudoniella acicularis]|uniref:SET domain-containing protein n=1 Tax=Cudoniella acicularis TaxID=354080 RepID=A0A8H4RAV6_9HELO|nr:hypothetical protein G7Y89_g12935 [Cudoniella acicularis]
MHQDPEQTKIEVLLQWAQQFDTSLHPDVEIYQDLITGLSFRALNDIAPDTRLVSCSYNTTLSYLNAIQASDIFQRHDSQPFPSEFTQAMSPEDPNIIGHFFLMQQYLMGYKSFWWNYIRLLPQPDETKSLALPIWWPESDRIFLAGTNAEPPISKRQQLWKAEWERGIDLLKHRLDHWENYNYILYQWAATIFGTRSFRASLTISEELLKDSSIRHQTLDHVGQDRFSILLPVLDIGNHDGMNRVHWSKEPISGQFILSSSEAVKRNNQIYNYYGDKSNSELLVGYGFTLPDPKNDIVNLKLTPAVESIQLRRSQKCHVFPSINQPEEEFMFKMLRGNVNETGTELVELQFFSHGLFDTLACMVANRREHRFIAANPAYCLETDLALLSGPLYRSIFLAFHVLTDKLDYETKRIQEIGARLPLPQNQNQVLALNYRERQLGVLTEALTRIRKRIHAASTFNSFCGHAYHNQISASSEQYLLQIHSQVELLALECAFNWLHVYYPDIHDAVTKIISEDQDEPLPLDWTILVDDWDNTYWIVWIALLWMLWSRDGESFLIRHKDLSSWLSEMNVSYDYQLVMDNVDGIFYAEPSEQDTINHTLQQIIQLPQFNGLQKWLSKGQNSWKTLRNFASLVAKEEAISAHFSIKNVEHADTQRKLQKMLVIGKKREPTDSPKHTLWTQFLGGSPGFTSPTD